MLTIIKNWINDLKQIRGLEKGVELEVLYADLSIELYESYYEWIYDPEVGILTPHKGFVRSIFNKEKQQSYDLKWRNN